MSRLTPTSRAYKELTLQQLRSFCETARLGSLTAAATALGMAHPTVWKQVHALEREFGAPLIEPHARGCRLTPAGRLLADLAGPAVASIVTLKRHFLERFAETEASVTVAATPRIVVDDLPACVVEFERRHPRVRLALKEVRNEEVVAAVESGKADLGLTGDAGRDPNNPRLMFEPCYELDIYLITPRSHPLARRRTLRPRDLVPYPLVNAPAELRDIGLAAALERQGLHFTEPRRVEASYAHAIRRYVELGFGIALIGGLPTQRPHPRLHERLMSRYFGRLPIYLVWRRGVWRSEAAAAFAETVKALLARPRKARTLAFLRARSRPKPALACGSRELKQ
jgi:DNA-binding transcriptional LysR family regulator